jgi:allantoinase
LGPVDLVVAGGRLVTPDGVAEAAVAVEDGIIVAIGRDGAMPPARRRVEADGRYVLPGAIDVHVHFREPGFSHKETWTTATQAAAIGGVTTVLDMPNTNPSTATAAAVREKIAIASRQSLVDFGIYGYVGETNLDQLVPMAQAGAAAFKLYMGSENPLVPCPNDGAILDAFTIIRELGLRCTVHAENTPILEWRGRQLRAAGRNDAAAHLEKHTDIAAVDAVSRTALFSEWTGCPVHIAHENSRHSLPVIAAAKARGVDLTAETCPHYLLLSTDDGARVGPNALRVIPPVREPGHAEPLWDALIQGTIDVLSTDHAPHLRDEKHRASIWDCAPGFPGVEISMRLMLTEVRRGRMTLSQYVRMACEAPARAFGLYPRKGALLPGSDADLVVVDTERRDTISTGRLHSIGRETPFHGWETIGLPAITFVRGSIVAENGTICGKSGWGRHVVGRLSHERGRPRRSKFGESHS